MTLSSLNRHATAVLADVGTAKVLSVERVLKQISRDVHVDSIQQKWSLSEDGAKMLLGADWVIGMHDSYNPLLSLIDTHNLFASFRCYRQHYNQSGAVKVLL